jgi:hypothetical protein
MEEWYVLLLVIYTVWCSTNALQISSKSIILLLLIHLTQILHFLLPIACFSRGFKNTASV